MGASESNVHPGTGLAGPDLPQATFPHPTHPNVIRNVWCTIQEDKYARLDKLSRVYLTRQLETLAHLTVKQNHMNTCRPMFPPPPKPTISHSPLIFSRQHPPSFAPLSIFQRHVSNIPQFSVSILHHPPLCQYFIDIFQIFLNWVLKKHCQRHYGPRR